MSGRIPAAEKFALAASIVDSDPVIRTYAAPEWDELHNDGKVWIAAIVSETQRRGQSEIERLHMLAKANNDLARHHVTDRHELQIMKRNVHERMDECDGFWRACSGCQESVDGSISLSDYPRSEIFRCQPGSGCRECGGIGVIWDNHNYNADAIAALASDHG